MQQQSVLPCENLISCMNDGLTNLLPLDRQRSLSREYMLRVGVVAAVLATILSLVAGLLLVPTHILLSQSATTKKAHLVNIESVLSSSNEKALSAQLARLSRDATMLLALGKTQSPTAVVRETLAVSHPGVALSGFSYSPAVEKIPGTLAVIGTAISRDALRKYQLALQKVDFVAAANLPVSAYAKDTDISFTITATLSP